jgi:hypothetical protein
MSVFIPKKDCLIIDGIREDLPECQSEKKHNFQLPTISFHFHRMIVIFVPLPTLEIISNSCISRLLPLSPKPKP